MVLVVGDHYSGGMGETVKVRISIEISTEDDADTGLTVEQWNALTDAERSAMVRDMWDTYASSADSGGMQVLTAGAADI